MSQEKFCYQLIDYPNVTLNPILGLHKATFEHRLHHCQNVRTHRQSVFILRRRWKGMRPVDLEMFMMLRFSQMLFVWATTLVAAQYRTYIACGAILLEPSPRFCRYQSTSPSPIHLVRSDFSLGKFFRPCQHPSAVPGPSV